MISIVVSLPLLFCNWVNPTLDKADLAKKARRAVEHLESLAFDVDFEYDLHRNILTKKAEEKHSRCQLKVFMADGRRFRVEVYDDDRSVAMVVSDGKLLTEWNGTENVWTVYPLPASDGIYLCRKLYFPYLASEYPRICSFFSSWVDSGSSYARVLEERINAPEFKTVITKYLDRRKCDVLKATVKEFTMGYTSNTVELYFDQETHFCVKEIERVKAVGALTQSMTLQTTHRNIRPNAALRDGTFVFNPPAGSRFISLDDTRFDKPKKRAIAKQVVLDGKPAPAIALASVRGKTVSLADLNQRHTVLLVFWATWCPPCNMEIPTLVKLHRDFGKKGLSILAVSTDKSAKTLKEFVERRELPYTVLHDSKNKASQSYSVTGIPRTFLINTKGIVVKSWIGWAGKEEEAEIRRELAKLLK